MLFYKLANIPEYLVNLTLIASFSGVALFVGMLFFFGVGRRFGLARLLRDPGGLATGTGAAEGAVFGLLGLILAFSFSGAATRFEERRHLITEEANAIGTAYLRLDLLQANAQPELRTLFRQYLDIRSTIYHNSQDDSAARNRLQAVTKLQNDIWNKSLIASQAEGASPDAAKLLLPALNEMIDITTTRSTATQNHPPIIVYLLLSGLSLIGALLVGYAMSANKGRSWLHSISFAAVISLASYVIIDLEFPRLGLIRIDAADKVLVDLRESLD